MYIREKLVKILKIKNTLIIVVGILNIANSVAIMVSLVSHYWGDFDTVINARATPGCINSAVIGVFMILYALISKRLISDVYFYSSYFEGDLDGNIKYSHLSGITGRGRLFLMLQLRFLRLIYMKNFKITNNGKEEQITLYSKKCLCECRNCGAVIEKKVYFTGICPYCRGSDLFAKVLTDNRFYSISSSNDAARKQRDSYIHPKLGLKRGLLAGLAALAVCIFLMLLSSCITEIRNYNDHDYLVKVLLSGKSYSSFDLIKKEMREDIIWMIVFMAAVLPWIITALIKLVYVFTAFACSKFFSSYSKPFIALADFPLYKNKKRKIRRVKGSICRSYLRGCSFENHDGEMKIALARKIVKDKCPGCAAPIVGAVDEKYKCTYCGKLIMGVVSKK